MDTQALQEKVHAFIHEKKMAASIEIRLLDLCSEVGELCKEVLKGNQYGKSELCLGKNFENELGDVLFSLICIANAANIDLAFVLEKTLEKYAARIVHSGEADSGR